MNRIKYLIAKIRLFFAHNRVNAAKLRMNNVIRSSRAAQDEIDDSYEKFLNRCKQQEKAAVAVKRLQGDSDNPILDIDLGVKHFILNPSLSKRLTRLDAEVAVTRHRYGDWGEVTLQNWRSNNAEVSNPYGMEMKTKDYEAFIRSRITELRLIKNVSEHRMSLDLDKSGSYIRGITNGLSMPSVKELINIILYFDMTPIDFFSTLDQKDSAYNQLCERLRNLDEATLEKVATFLDMIV